MKNRAVIFVLGVMVGRYLEKNQVFSLPYQDRCKIEDCKFTVASNQPDVTMQQMHEHMLEKHPGWVKK